MVATAPAVVKPRQKIDSTSAGKFPLAASANARPTMKATFWPLNSMPSTIASDAQHDGRDARHPQLLLARRLAACARTLTQRSCESAAAPESVSPATTARMVANATAAMKPRSAVPPSTSASSGAAMLPPLSTATIASRPTSTIAPKPSTKVSR